jgi:hypothetical protein
MYVSPCQNVLGSLGEAMSFSHAATLSGSIAWTNTLLTRRFLYPFCDASLHGSSDFSGRFLIHFAVDGEWINLTGH